LNSLRGLLREFGIAIPLGARHVVPRVRELLVEPTPVLDLVRPALANAWDEIAALEAKMEALEHQLLAIGRTMPDVALLQTVPGVGLLTPTALVALVSDIRRFRSRLVTLRSRSRIRNRTASFRSTSPHETCRACCVTQASSGRAVQPARWTRQGGTLAMTGRAELLGRVLRHGGSS
jgi:hypothetical protein